MSGNLAFTRRALLKTVTGAVGGALAGCGESATPATSSLTRTATRTTTDQPSDSPTETEQETETPRRVDPLDHEKLIGAYYYPWYTSDDWTRRAAADPVLGNYRSTDAEVIARHVKWAVESGINWFPVSWAADARDTWIENHFLEVGLSQEIEFTVFYESKDQLSTSGEGRSGTIDLDDPENRQQLVSDFRTFSDRYFDEPNYLRVEDRPVLPLFAVNKYEGDVSGAVEAARESIDEDPFVVADVVSWKPPTREKRWLDSFDAVTTYNPLAGKDWIDANFERFLTRIERVYENWRKSAAEDGVAFVPVVVPGYDKSRAGGASLLRRSPSRFRDFIDRVAPYMDSDLEAMLVTSFNEWPETTAVEPAEQWGSTYLEIVAELARSDPDYVDTSSHVPLELDFNKTVVPGDGDDRPLSFMAGGIEFVDEADVSIVQYDIGVVGKEPILTEGVYPPHRNPDLRISSWRWFGGPTERTRLYVPADVTAPTAEVRMFGNPIDDGVRAEVALDGGAPTTVAFDSGIDRYSIEIETG